MARPHSVTNVEDGTMMLWLDVNDPYMVIIGDKLRVQRDGETVESYAAWSSMHIDGISDLFGGDVAESVKRLKQKPAGTAVEVQLVELRLVEEGETRGGEGDEN